VAQVIEERDRGRKARDKKHCIKLSISPLTKIPKKKIYILHIDIDIKNRKLVRETDVGEIEIRKCYKTKH
jgi:hypothetical protein